MTFARSFYVAASAAALLSSSPTMGQCDRWQQWIQVALTVDLDVQTHRFTGTESLRYTNNSPDTIQELWFHLYFNAFRPGSEMDVRSRTISDPDPRVGSRIAALAPEEQGELRVGSMTQAGKAVRLEHLGTVLRARLASAIPPGSTGEVELLFSGQVPVQVRRSGRNNVEGVAYSMAQWYPKVAAYDARGWHAEPYVGREFYGEWGNYNLEISPNSSYTVAATGVLQNPEEVGHGYAPEQARVRGGDGRTQWHFRADSVHDVAWVADQEFAQITAQVPNGPLLRFFFQDTPELRAEWEQLPAHMVRSFQFMSEQFGRYPWPEYTIAQGGDGGMEYPMLTLITGKRKLGSLVGVSVHESVHSWYYGVLASDEGHFPWMDEGFTEYAGSKVMQHLFGGTADPHASAYEGYRALMAMPEHEPMSVHGDHFETNRAYGITAYSKGEMFLQQLGYVIGDTTMRQGLLRYFDACRFKHPMPVDLERSMEKASGLELDWYFDEWINTTRVTDYGVDTLVSAGDSTQIRLRRLGAMVMPVDVKLTDAKGDSTVISIPLSLMRGAKPAGSEHFSFNSARPWSWPDPTYTLRVPGVWTKVELFSAGRLADMDPSNDRKENEAPVPMPKAKRGKN
ncbi:MAG: M1 family metallopeptidase [Flavobacteriales bacterium]|nr:M1 family metallopeptidase [Flavobacteriales bacterium]